MKRYLKWTFRPYVFLSLIVLGSCVVAINENDYRLLRNNDKELVKEFNMALLDTAFEQAERVSVYEINTIHIREITKRNPYTLLHLWRPGCSSANCINISSLPGFEKAYQAYGLKTLLVSEYYLLKHINAEVKSSSYNAPVFVLQDSYYGHKVRSNKLKLCSELGLDQANIPKTGFNDFLFKDTLLIYTGNRITSSQLDSLIMQ